MRTGFDGIENAFVKILCRAKGTAVRIVALIQTLKLSQLENSFRLLNTVFTTRIFSVWSILLLMQISGAEISSVRLHWISNCKSPDLYTNHDVHFLKSDIYCSFWIVTKNRVRPRASRYKNLKIFEWSLKEQEVLSKAEPTNKWQVYLKRKALELTSTSSLSLIIELFSLIRSSIRKRSNFLPKECPRIHSLVTRNLL